jgi:hypothetical protein
LKDHGVASEKIRVLPCVVNMSLFVGAEKKERRQAENISHHAVVGIYVGKFGGIYYDKEAYDLFSEMRNVFPECKMIVLTPQDKTEVERNLLEVGFLPHEILVKNARHDEVPYYLSMADFAFATYKASASKRFLSPIKVGEYWACGLPVLLTKGTGDDSDIIESTGCGALFLPGDGSGKEALKKISQQLQDPMVHEKNVSLALRYRNFRILEDTYQQLLKSVTS